MNLQIKKLGLASFELQDLLKTTGQVTQGIGFTQRRKCKVITRTCNTCWGRCCI